MIQNKILKDGDDLREINLTPLIDVCLVLVVILLVTTPVAFESAINVRNAAAAARKAAVTSPSERIEIHLVDDDVVEINRAPATRLEILGKLPALLAGSTTRRVVVSCAPGVSHGAFVNVLDLAKSSGAAEIAVLGN